ncbi:hypothetical protein B0I26_11243 [Anoxybacillus vitaminiphilus]|jgi:uncharacterized membrane protein YczE|uniref:Membrane protein YczE n=1 Tax=Paranoxybacillus vitaminiphilus TaxID=581036 RepID=A0A327YB69_9BACL|nr:YitT family protein [Anoxybacillus vitaminiphilus]RAK17322.1 hypothetical protein B0I26_11243 [Anoxybacillus vitaminiphilus]
MTENDTSYKFSDLMVRWGIYFTGLLVMCFGIVLMIKANLGSAPWDVLHIGLYRQFGLTIGTWSIIVGLAVLTAAALISRRFPQIGAFANMVFVGLFIDLYMLIPWIRTPDMLWLKFIMFLSGIVINGYGMGLYISAKMGAGPRDSLMLALMELTGWKVQYIRIGMEVLVLFIGWLLDGPVAIGTFIFSVAIGSVAGMALPQCQSLVNRILMRQVPMKMNGLNR